jgi:hypothetical protein
MRHQLIASLLFFVSTAAGAMDLESMNRLMENNQCPSDLNRYRHLTYTAQCGRRQGPGPDPVWRACTDRVDDANKTIARFNDFLLECRRIVDRRYRK